VGCDACAKICPQEAIKFPDKEELRATLRKLRAEAQQSKAPQPPSEDSNQPTAVESSGTTAGGAETR